MGRASLKLVISNSEKHGLEPFCKFLLLKCGLKHNTINNYRKIVTRYLAEIGDRASTVQMAENYIADMYLSECYGYYHITNTIRALERFMEYMGTPIQFARPRKPKRIPKEALSEAEIAVFIAATKNVREKAIIGILAYGGIRNEELCNLRVKDVDVSDNSIFVRQGKGSKDRVVPVSGDCIKLVMQYLAKFPRGDDDFLFATLRLAEQYNGWALRRLIKRIARRANMEKRISPHTFRRSLASNMSARGADVQTIQYILGHSSIETTMLYISINPKRVHANYLRYAPSYV